MDPKYAVLLAVRGEEHGELRAKTLLQKKLYFAALLTGDDFGFRPHYYGPYSRQVADAADSLVSNGFLEERIDVFPGEANVFGEWRRHSYKLPEDGERLLQSLADDIEVKAWRSALRKINKHSFGGDFNLLSIAAKVATIVHEFRLATVDEIETKAKEYGWKLTPSDISRVGEFLEYLGR